MHPCILAFTSFYSCILDAAYCILYPGSWMLYVGFSILDSAIWMEECGLGTRMLPYTSRVPSIWGPPHMQHMLQIHHISPNCNIIYSHSLRNTPLGQHLEPQHPRIRASEYLKIRESENPSIRASENPRIRASEHPSIRVSRKGPAAGAKP